MNITYETMEQTLIPNTITDKMLIDGVHQAYRIKPIEGYVLHDNAADSIDELGNVVLRFSSGSCSCGATYDFTTSQKTVTDINGNTVIATAYGSREFFAFPENLVADPEYNIYGGGTVNPPVTE